MNKKNYKSEGKARVLLNLLSDPAVIIDQKGLFLMANAEFGKVTGLKPKELIGKPFLSFDILPAESKAILLKNLSKRPQGVPVAPYEIHFTNTAGEKRFVEVKGKRINYAGQPADLVVFHDVTRRKENARRLEEYAEIMEALVEEKLKETKESEEKFRAITNSALDAMFMFDEEDRIAYWNSAAERIFGYTEKEIVGKQVNATLVPPRFRKDHLKLTGKLAKSEEKAHTGKIWEFPALRKGGAEFPMELSMAPLQLNGKTYFVAIARDITERKKAEEVLRLSEAKYRELINGMNDTAWVIDLDANFVDVNDAAVKVLGYSREELLSMGPTDIDSSLSREQIIDLVTRMPADQVQVFETSHTSKDGRKIPVEISSSLVNYQGKQAVLSIARDITDRKRLQELDKAFSELSYRLVSPASIEEISSQILDYAQQFTQSPVGYVGYVDHKTGYLVVPTHTQAVWDACKMENKTTIFKDFRGLWGWGLKNQKTFFTNTPNTDPRAIGTPKGGLPIHRFLSVPAVLEGKLLGQIAVANSSRPYTEEDAKVVERLAALYAMALHRAQTRNQLEEYANSLEEKVAERTKQLEEANQRLLKAERLAAIGELAGMVGHDLRNPLTGIKNAAYYLRVKQYSSFDDNSKKMLEIIDSAIDHADKIIGDLQDYSREMHLERANCSPRSILQEALALVQVPDRVKIIDNTLDEPLIRADNAKMVRVFINIIKNAVDAMPEGGTLHAKSVQTDGNVELSFADTGIGMSKETLSKIFSPLVTTKAQGMGFGLAICKRIVEAHQGRITVQSVEGKGSTFTVIIPIEPKLKDGGEATWINVPESLLLTTTKT